MRIESRAAQTQLCSSIFTAIKQFNLLVATTKQCYTPSEADITWVRRIISPSTEEVRSQP